jgi:type VI secretion system protein VasJ
MEKVDAGIEGLETEKCPKDKHDTFLADLEAIDTFLAENIEDAPVLRSFNERLTSLVEAIEPPPEPTPAPDAPGAPAGEAAETPETAGEPSEAAPAPAAPAPARPEADISDADGETLFKQGLEIFGRAATLYMNQEQISPVPFRLNRIVAWMPVENLPPATGEKTLIPPPDEQVITSLQNMYKSQSWDELLKAAESRIRQFLFWLDLSRYTAEALEQMKYPAISEAVGYETAAYVNRLSGIDKLTFADGTPFADEETREWLKSIAGKQGGTDGTSSSGGSDVEQQVAKELAEAQKKIKENKLSEALTGFSGKLNRASSVHERFIWMLGLCSLLLRAKKPQLVLPYIKEILKMMDNFKIEQWEPKLAVDGFDLVLSGLRLQGENKDEELIENVLNRISALNPARALELM